MRDFTKYVSTLESLAEAVLSDSRLLVRYREPLSAALNGGPARELRRTLSLDKQRKYGSFFTGDELGLLMSEQLLRKNDSSNILDPACGTGNLLLLASRTLPVREDLDTTLDDWGQRLFGFELRPALARATRARLAMQASLLFPNQPQRCRKLEDYFPNVRVANALSKDVSVAPGSRILMNPPFFKQKAPADCEWGSGGVSAAAIFLDQFLRRAPTGTEIIAILPEVLRSGTLYEKWRGWIETLSTVESITLFGQFDRTTDINVFIAKFISGVSSDKGFDWWPSTVTPNSTVGDHFDVSVGAVVPFRNKDEGLRVPYVHAKKLNRWGTVEPSERRGFKGTLVRGPFVVVRRTSRVEDGHRAVATIIKSSLDVAVENHLLVLKPKDLKMQTCKKLLSVLKSPKTDSWLNHRIRCRHLTTSSLKELPWLE